MNKQNEQHGTMEISSTELAQLEDGSHSREQSSDSGMPNGKDVPEMSAPPAVPYHATRSKKLIPGDVVDGRYEIKKQLGVGAMGTVFLVNHLRLNKPFALKVVKPSLARRPQYVARFEREAHACSRLDHPNCISVTDFGHTAEGDLYLVMEYVDGIQLADIAADTPIPLKDALAYTRQILVGLEHAHAKGLVHRDIKMENILKCHRDNDEVLIKILDFGMAKPSMDDTAGQTEEDQADSPRETIDITQKGIVVGTPQYISPEQVGGHEADERGDLYAAGITLYRLITGKSVFKGEAIVEIFKNKIDYPAPTLCDATGIQYPDALESFIAKALERNPDDRYLNAAQMLAEFDRMRIAIGDASSDSLGALDPIVSQNAKKTSSIVKAKKYTRLAIAIGVVLFGVAVAVGTGLYFVRAAQQEEQRRAAAAASKKIPIKKEVKVPDNTPHPALLEAKILIERKKCRRALDTLTSSMASLGTQAAVGHYLLGQSNMCLNRSKDALAQYTHAIEKDDKYRKDGILIEDVKKMLSNKKVRQDAMALMVGPLGEEAMPTLIHMAGNHQNKKLRHQALEYVTSKGMSEHVNMERSLELDLLQTGSCKEKRNIVSQLEALGTNRAKKVLMRAWDAQLSGGLYRKDHVHECVRADIGRALSTLRQKKNE